MKYEEYRNKMNVLNKKYPTSLSPHFFEMKGKDKTHILIQIQQLLELAGFYDKFIMEKLFFIFNEVNKEQLQKMMHGRYIENLSIEHKLTMDQNIEYFNRYYSDKR